MVVFKDLAASYGISEISLPIVMAGRGTDLPFGRISRNPNIPYFPQQGHGRIRAADTIAG